MSPLLLILPLVLVSPLLMRSLLSAMRVWSIQ